MFENELASIYNRKLHLLESFQCKCLSVCHRSFPLFENIIPVLHPNGALNGCPGLLQTLPHTVHRRWQGLAQQFSGDHQGEKGVVPGILQLPASHRCREQKSNWVKLCLSESFEAQLDMLMSLSWRRPVSSDLRFVKEKH